MAEQSDRSLPPYNKLGKPTAHEAEAPPPTPPTAPRRAATPLTAAISRALPRVGDLSFVTFTGFILTLFLFTVFTDAVLCIVVVRANIQGLGFPTHIEVLNYLWIAVHALLFSDLFCTYFRFYRPRAGCCEDQQIRGSRFLKPMCWRCVEPRLKTRNLQPRDFLLFLALSLPLNALLFYDGLGSPAYDPPNAELATRNLTELLSEESWPNGSGLLVSLGDGSITGPQRGNATLPRITNMNCYRTDSNEFQILARLQGNDLANFDYPKQAHCETFLGTIMVSGCLGRWNESLKLYCEAYRSRSRSISWMSNEDRWDEAFQFTLRLFSSLVGIMSDQAHGGENFWFLKDMTDVFDMFMMTFADVDQMHEGRPPLAGHKLKDMTGYYRYQVSYHTGVWCMVWVGVAVVFMRAAARVDVEPIVWFLGWAGCERAKAAPEDLRTPIDAVLSLLAIETPYLLLRWIAWYHYGVPVSVMAVKNVLGVLEDLHLLGVLHGFTGVHSEPRGLQLCFRWLRPDPGDPHVGGEGPEASI